MDDFVNVDNFFCWVRFKINMQKAETMEKNFLVPVENTNRTKDLYLVPGEISPSYFTWHL